MTRLPTALVAAFLCPAAVAAAEIPPPPNWCADTSHDAQSYHAWFDRTHPAYARADMGGAEAQAYLSAFNAEPPRTGFTAEALRFYRVGDAVHIVFITGAVVCGTFDVPLALHRALLRRTGSV